MANHLVEVESFVKKFCELWGLVPKPTLTWIAVRGKHGVVCMCSWEVCMASDTNMSSLMDQEEGALLTDGGWRNAVMRGTP